MTMTTVDLQQNTQFFVQWLRKTWHENKFKKILACMNGPLKSALTFYLNFGFSCIILTYLFICKQDICFYIFFALFFSYFSFTTFCSVKCTGGQLL